VNIGHYYNEFAPFPAQWLRNLMDAGELPKGTVDERSIEDLAGDDVRGFAQAHFFAGIGGWPLALRLAGWPADRPVWTGSCPCQPFSAAGKRKGTADKRHLWPAFRDLIAECRPATIFGEQVASADGREWLAGVRADLEALGYAVGAADMCAAGAGSPHIRQRLWWVANGDGGRRFAGGECGTLDEVRSGKATERLPVAESGSSRRLPDSAGARRDGTEQNAEGEARNEAWVLVPGEHVLVGGIRNASGQGLEKRVGDRGIQREAVESSEGQTPIGGGDAGYWSRFDVLPFGDGKSRRVEPGTFPLAHGVPGRVGRISAYGNAIVPQVAAEFIRAFLEAESPAASVAGHGARGELQPEEKPAA
jgi:DNA (cytosine-5)-methyltransferase 1